MHKPSKTKLHVILGISKTYLPLKKTKKPDHMSAQENKNKTINLKVSANDLLLTSVVFF